MLSRIFVLAFLLVFSSCALFRTGNVQNKNLEELLTYLPSEGEGRGRLGLNHHQYLFGFESVFQNNNDWILAANIPLHGEEVLRFSDLKVENPSEETLDGLELRIQKGIEEYLISQKQSSELGKTFLRELRGILRLILHRQIGEKVVCSSETCQLGKSLYLVKSSSDQLSLKKSIGELYEIEFAALNLVDTKFKRTSVFLRSQNRTSSAQSILSLELFWN